MKAIEIPAPGPPEVLRLVDRPDPVPGPGEVLIAVVAAGVNRPDLMQRQGNYPAPKGTTDIPGRLGGEEFAVLLPETDTDQAMVFAERLRADLEQLEVLHNDKTIRFSCSFGVALRADDVAVLDTLLMRADEALYRAKNDGRNRVAAGT